MGNPQQQVNLANQVQLQEIQAEMVRLKNQQIIDKYSSTIAGHINAWLDNEAESWHDGVNDTISALYLADHYYDDVMSAQEKPKWYEAVIKGLIGALAGVQPEFAMFAAVLQFGVLLSDGDEKEQKERQEKVNFIKEGAAKAIEAGIAAAEENEKIERAERRMKARTNFIKDTINACSKTAHWVTKMHYATKVFVADQDVPDPLQIQRIWGVLVGYSKCKNYRDGMDDQWARLFLYDMLRAYCAQSVRLVMAMGAVKRPLSQGEAQRMIAGSGGSLIEFEGLEPPKREAMYKYFDGIDNFYGRPEIKSKEEGGQGYIDLINNWKFGS